MRQGPDYRMNLSVVREEILMVKVPIELSYEFEYAKGINWHDNGDGTYTLTIIKNY